MKSQYPFALLNRERELDITSSYLTFISENVIIIIIPENVKLEPFRFSDLERRLATAFRALGSFVHHRAS